MPRYLSTEWFDDAQTALAGDSTLSRAVAKAQLTVQQVVTGGPDGDITYHIDVDRGTVKLATGEADDPTVTFIQSWDTAVAIGRGEQSAQGAFMTGQIRVRGDLPRLVEQGDVFAGVDDVLAALRAATTY